MASPIERCLFHGSLQKALLLVGLCWLTRWGKKFGVISRSGLCLRPHDGLCELCLGRRDRPARLSCVLISMRSLIYADTGSGHENGVKASALVGLKTHDYRT